MIISAKWQREELLEQYSPTKRKPLVLTAFTRRVNELGAFAMVLRDVGIPVQGEVERSSKETFTQSETVAPGILAQLERRLDLFFLDYGGRVEILPGWLLRGIDSRVIPPAQKKKNYCCHELTTSGDGDAEPIEASDDVDAMFVCGLLGGQRHWFGAKPVSGECPRQR